MTVLCVQSTVVWPLGILQELATAETALEGYSV